jgi:hypothetical protein
MKRFLFITLLSIASLKSREPQEVSFPSARSLFVTIGLAGCGYGLYKTYSWTKNFIKEQDKQEDKQLEKYNEIRGYAQKIDTKTIPDATTFQKISIKPSKPELLQ